MKNRIISDKIINNYEVNKTRLKVTKVLTTIVSISIIIIAIKVLSRRTIEYPILETALFFMRIFNFILLFLASCSCLTAYKRLKQSQIFIIALAYISLATGCLFGQVDYITCNYNYGQTKISWGILPSILRTLLLVISLLPKSKIHTTIVRNKTKSAIFVIIFTTVGGIVGDILFAQLKKSIIFFNIYFIYLTIAYTITSIVLIIKCVIEEEYLFMVLGASVFMFAIKGIFSMITVFNISFYRVMTLISITYISSIIVIAGSFLELYIFIDESAVLTNNLEIFYNIVDNERHNFEFIFNKKAEMIYCNQKAKEYFIYQNKDRQKMISSILSKISSEFSSSNSSINTFKSTGGWRGIIRDDACDKIFSCSVQLVSTNDRRDIAVSFVDITDIIKTELELEQLKALNIERMEFMSNISHELRTPLNIFYSTVQLLDLSYKNEGDEFKRIYSRYNKTLHMNCKRMLRLINNVIDISKIDIGTIDNTFSNYNIVYIVEDVTLSVINYAKLKNIDVKFDTNSEERILRCDPNLIERAILNLLSNAIKFSPEKSIVTVEVIVHKNFTEINVKDEGVGISPENSKIIFDKFTRGDKTFTRENEGSGIGLSVVKSIVDLHEGYIDVNSEVGKGSTFKILLPNIVNENEECNMYDITNYNVEMELSDIYEVIGACSN